MKRRFMILTLLFQLFIGFVIAHAQQQPGKSRGLDTSQTVAMPTILGLSSRHSGKDFGISVRSREKIFWLSFARLKESWTVSQALWPNSSNAR